MKDGELTFTPSPKLDNSFFDDKDEVSFPLFSKVIITYHNPGRINLYEGCKLSYMVNGQKYDVIKGQLAHDLRDGKINKIYIEVTR